MALIKTVQNKRIDIKADGFIIDTSTEHLSNGMTNIGRNVSREPNFPDDFATERQEIQDIATAIQNDLMANPLPVVPATGYFEAEEIKIEVLADKQMQIQKATVVYEDGERFGSSYRRHVVDVGQDITNEHPRVKVIAGVVHTAQAISDRQSFIASQNAI